jgi:hypothetical protein
MLRVVRIVFGVVAIFMLAISQVFGLHRGYLCGCLGDGAWADRPECVAERCHPGAAHEDGCLDHHGDVASPGNHEDEEPAGSNHSHRHFEVREWDSFAAAGGLVSPPPPASSEANGPCEPLGYRSISAMAESLPWLNRGIERSPPPMSVVVARSVVRLV